jgi:hypothetical protein
MTCNKFWRPFAISCLALLFAALAQQADAQIVSGSISGNVKDQTGAYVPAASINLEAPAIGVSRSAVTTKDGTFIVTDLPAGSYTVTASAPGFRTLIKTGLILSAGDRASAGDLTLAVGSTTESVTVQTDAGQLQVQSQSGERSDVITKRQIDNIGMNGRNILDMMRLIPGVTSTFSGGESGKGSLDQFNINGTRGNQHNFTLDGISNVDSGSNGAVQVTINPDAIAEVKVLTSNFQAEYGKAAGGQIAVSTVGGTKTFHGNGRYFFRDRFLNANSYFNNLNGVARPQYHYNYAGYQIGGPVIFPGTGFNHGHDKLFFFFSQEYYNQLLPAGNPQKVYIPTAAEMSGDFSQSKDGNGTPIIIKDPENGNAPFTGNKIPSARILPYMQAAMQSIYPTTLANISGNSQYNLYSQLSGTHPRREDIARVDWQINERNRAYARYIHNKDIQVSPYGSSSVWGTSNFGAGNGMTITAPGWGAVLNLTSTLSPTLVNEFSGGTTVNTIGVTPVSQNVFRNVANSNIPLVYQVSGGTPIPDLNFSGIVNQTLPSSYLGAIPFTNSATLIDINDALTKSLGKHTVKTGIYFERSRKDQIAFANANGSFSFNGQTAQTLQTGSPFANALLGYYSSFQQTSQRLTGRYRFSNVEGYIQDTWRIAPRLTLDYGMRFTYYMPQYDAAGQIQNFYADQYDPSKAVRLYMKASNGTAYDPANPSVTGPAYLVGNIVPNSGVIGNGIRSQANGFPRGGIDDRGVMYEPRFGFAYDISGQQTAVIRGGFGISHDRYQGSPLYNMVVQNPPAVLSPTYQQGRVQDLASLGGTGSGQILGPQSLDAFDRTGQVPTVYSYSLGVQQNIGKGITLDIAYVGNESRHLSQQVNANYVPYGTAFTKAAQDPSLYPGGVVPDSETGIPAIYAAQGVKFWGDKAFTNSNFVRRYQGYSDIPLHGFVGIGNYNSLQVSVQRRFSHGFTFGGVYTWSRTFTSASSDETYVSPYGPRAYNYTLASFDRPQVAAINYVYDLPRFSRMLGNHRWVGIITDGFQLSGITQFRSGPPTSVGIALPNSGQYLSGSYTEAPNLYLRSDPRRSVGTSAFDPSAFVLPSAIGFQQPWPRNYIRSPGTQNWDMSIFKNIRFSDTNTSRYMQLRLEGFNVWNHVNYSAYKLGSNTVVPTANGGYSTDTKTIMNNYASAIAVDPRLVRATGCTGITGNCFGEKNTQNSGNGGPRVVQLAAKLYF